MRLAATLALAALASCSSSSDPAGPTDPGGGNGAARADVSAFVEGWLDAYLAGASACEHSTPAFIETWDLYGRAAWSARMMDLWDRGLLRFDAALATQCLSLTTSPASCDAGWATRSPPPDHPCAKALWGTKGLGQACSAGPECAPDLFCDGDAGVCPGVCSVRGTEGAACVPGAGDCQRHLACFRELATSKDFCRSTHLPQGSGCTGGAGSCALGLYCDVTTTHCELLPSSAGNACGNGAECAPGLYCDPLGKCQPRVALTGACVVNDASCVEGARCDGTGACVEHAVAGGACGDLLDGGEPQECAVSACVSGTCTAFPERGAAAVAGAPCAPYGLGVADVGGACNEQCP